MNNKRKIIIVGIIICVLLIGISIALICIVKHGEVHRYLEYDELPEDAIVFRVEMSVWNTYVEEQKYDVSGKRYFTAYTREHFYDNTTKDIISEETDESFLSEDEVKYMYELLLQTDKKAEYERLSHTITNDSSYSYFVGILYRADGEVEYVYLASGQSTHLLERMDDPYAKEICDWLLQL